MEVTVAVVCSTDLRLADCLDSIPGNVSAVVVLNFPSRATIAIAARRPNTLVLRCDERNLGKLRQLAVEQAGTEGILFLDSDCILEPRTVEIVRAELDMADAVTVPMRYASTGYLSGLIARCRSYTTPEAGFFVPTAFRVAVGDRIGGYIYDARLEWGEDTEPLPRLQAAGADVAVSEGIVWHRPLSPLEDMRSVRSLGRGRRIRERAGLESPRRVRDDLRVWHELRLSAACVRSSGVSAGLYHLVGWRPMYKIGYWAERFRERKWCRSN